MKVCSACTVSVVHVGDDRGSFVIRGATWSRKATDITPHGIVKIHLYHSTTSTTVTQRKKKVLGQKLWSLGKMLWSLVIRRALVFVSERQNMVCV